MQMRIERLPSVDGATIGHLFVADFPWCFTLEDVVREVEGQPVESWKVFGQTAIPRGTYDVVVTFSPHFGRDLPLLLNVPGFDGVRIHPGNTAADTEGCILVGEAVAGNTVTQSRHAFDRLLPEIQRAIARSERVQITIA